MAYSKLYRESGPIKMAPLALILFGARRISGYETDLPVSLTSHQISLIKPGWTFQVFFLHRVG